MWPMLLDMSRDECKRILRRLELEAYASIITAFRAQGALTKEKKNLLKDIASELNISMERHRAEVRRAVNDEKLATIAEHMAGPDTGTEWAIVGRRLVPLMPRLVPQTAFTVLANNVANITAAGNARLPVPAATAKLPGSNIGPEMTSLEPVVSEGSKAPPSNPAQPSQAQSENAHQKPTVESETSLEKAVVVPDIPIKRELDEDDKDEVKEKCCNKRMKTEVEEAEVSSSVCSLVPTTQPAPAPVTTQAVSKVIIVSSSGSCGSPSILQRSLSVPMVKTSVASSLASSPAVTATSSAMSSAHSRGPTSYIINSGSSQSSSQSGTVVTISTGSSNENSTGHSSARSNSDCNMTATTVSIDGVPTTAYISSVSSGSLSGNSVSILGSGSSNYSTASSNVVHKLRPKPQSVSIGGISRPRTGPIVIPVTPNTHHPLHQSLACGSGTTGITVQQKSKSLLGVHTTKAETGGCTVSTLGKTTSGMKILPLSAATSNSGSSMAKILPKPAKGSSLFVVNACGAGTTTASQMSVVSRVVPTSALSPSPNLNLPTSSISVLGTRTVTTGSGNRININATAVARSTTSTPLSTSSSISSHLATNTNPGGTAVIMHQTGRAVTATVNSSSVPVTSSASSMSAAPTPPSSALSLGGACGKSNVIVVQKGPSGNTTFCRGVSLGPSTKEFVGKVLKGKTTAITVQRRPATSNNTSASSINNSVNVKNGPALNVPSSSSQGNVIVLDLSNEQLGSSSILNELLQGSGIIGDSINVPSNGMNSSPSSEEGMMAPDHSLESSLSPEVVEEIGPEFCQMAEPISSAGLNISQTRVVTLEEAVEMFGTSVGDNGEILLGKKAGGCDEVQKIVHISTSMKPNDVRGQDIVAVPPVEAEGVAKEEDVSENVKTAESDILLSEFTKDSMRPETKTMDIFSTAIASADINLNCLEDETEDG
ncbi:BRCA2-interacting transcriptional repressor EMSY-like isoform X2 [Ischnura elegans]|uniref:BRCA2-interacting transcriptional repressor EMSY-like isoform X2 n=1 Tax=Ischnura elegans TaxID=197161 RepID=UPI001ED89CE8|nr:BRCA2-interacting transcriptional repressor EMSY-like isoform X2 [Ischnura elegans]